MVHKEEFIKLHPEVTTGMEAYDYQGQRVGIIERIDDESITIEKGHILRHGVRLPYEAIEDIREDHVIIRPGESFEEGRMKSEEKREPQYERGRRAREESSGGERRERYEPQSTQRGLGTEETTGEGFGLGETGMEEDLGEGRWQQSPRRESGLEEFDISSRTSAGSGWEERESAPGEKEARVSIQEEEAEVTRKPAGKEEVKREPGKNVRKK
jgi:hypothetical protein